MKILVNVSLDQSHEGFQPLIPIKGGDWVQAVCPLNGVKPLELSQNTSKMLKQSWETVLRDPVSIANFSG
jgi:hypothetical protein